ncbi:MAG: hypothetical protein HQ475_10500 [SAR202 cluster bacterium]|nr:hypothetical protein [SAR202 cluster bacterium]
MFKGIFLAKEVTASIFKRWNALLLLGVGVFLLAAACTSTVPAEKPGATPPPTSITTPEPLSDDGTPSVNTPNTPEPGADRRPIPNDGDSTTRRIPETPVVESNQLLPSNTLALVLAISGGSSASTLKTIVNDSSTGEMLGTKFIALESSSKSVVLYLPDSGEVTVLNSYTSPSYAPHFKRPYTVNDHLYLSDKYTNGGSMTITEYSTSDLSREAEWGTSTDVIDPGYAVAGGQVYFKTASTEQWSMSRGFYNTPGDFIRSSFGDRSQTSELTSPETSFKLISSGDTIYGAHLPTGGDPVTGVFTVDPNTGLPAAQYIAAFEVDGLDNYMSMSFQHVVIEDGFAYWLAAHTSTATPVVEFYATDLTDPSGTIQQWKFSLPESSAAVSGLSRTFDVDGGYLVFQPYYEGGDRSKLVIYDTVEGTAELVDTGFSIIDTQVIYIE